MLENPIEAAESSKKNKFEKIYCSLGLLLTAVLANDLIAIFLINSNLYRLVSTLLLSVFNVGLLVGYILLYVKLVKLLNEQPEINKSR